MIYFITRDTRFSPNSITRDQAILKAVILELAKQAKAVRVVDESQLPPTFTDADLVLSMARSTAALQQLVLVEEAGTTVFNSPRHLLRNTRSHIESCLQRHGIAASFVPNCTNVTTIISQLHFPLWLKRGDTSAQNADDVRFVQNVAQLKAGLTHFVAQGFTDFIASQHEEGDLIKFYGVAGTDFFAHTYPTQGGFSKFGLETHNGTPAHHSFSIDALKNKADAVANETGMPIYGGDAIVQSDGSFFIIDFNDFPSFGSCTQTAAAAIVKLALSAL